MPLQHPDDASTPATTTAATAAASAGDTRSATATSTTRSTWGIVRSAVLVTLLYLVGAELSWRVFGADWIGLVFFPPAGITMAAFILLPRRHWPGMAAGIVAAELFVDRGHLVPWSEAAAYAAANMAEPIVGALLVHRLARGQVRLDRRAGLQHYLFGAVLIGPLVGALIGGTTKAVTSDHAWAAGVLGWLSGDGISVLTIGAPIIAVATNLWQGPRTSATERALVVALVVGASVVSFWFLTVPPALLLMPVLTWIALRFAVRGVAVASALIAIAANAATAAGRGPFGQLDLTAQMRLGLAQLFLASMILTAWFLAIETTQRHLAAREREEERAARARAESLQTIGMLGAELARSSTTDEVIATFEDSVRRHFGAAMCVVVRHDRLEDRFMPLSHGLPGFVVEEIARWDAATVAPGPLAMSTGRPVWVDSLAQMEARFPHLTHLVASRDFRSVGSIGLRGPDGPWGYVGLARSDRAVFSDQEREGLVALTQVLGQALVRAELLAEAQRRAALEHLRRNLSEAASRATSRVALKANVCRLLGLHLHATRVHWVDLNEDGEFGAPRVGYHPGAQSITGYQRVQDHGVALLDHVHSGRAVFVEDVTSDPRLTADERATVQALGVGAFALAPVRSAGAPVGLLVVHLDAAHHWTTTDRAAVEDTAARLWAGLVEMRTHASEERRRHRAAVLGELADRVGLSATAGDDLQVLVDIAVPRLAEVALLVDRDGAVVATSGLWHELSRRLVVDGQLRRGAVADAVAAAADGRSTLVASVPLSNGALPVLRSIVAVQVHADDAVLLLGMVDRTRDPFTHDDLAFFERLVERFDRHDRERRRRRVDHDVAVTLQRALLPTSVVADRSMAIEARYLAAAEMVEVGGDWYDTFRWPDGSIGLMVGDVVGHDLTSAATMGRLRAAASALAATIGPDPAALLDAIDGFCTGREAVGFATAACVVVDPATGVLAYASAGHPPGMVVRGDGSVIRLDGALSPPLGGFADRPRPLATATLDPGATLVLYSDGLVERRHESLDVGLARLEHALRVHRDRPTISFTDDVVAAMASATDDDVVVLCARYLPTRSLLECDLPARPESLGTLRRRVRSWLQEQGHADRTAQFEVLLPLDEACANSIEHAYRERGEAPIHVSLEDHGEHVRVEVQDRGSWRPPGRHNTGRGRGLPIMGTVAVDLVHDRHATGTTVSFTIPLTGAGRAVRP